jgi:methionine aminopeptidase
MHQCERSLVIIHFSLLIFRCHGIPDLRPLEEGDSVNIDITCFKHGVHGDNSVMVTLGTVNEKV